MYFDVIVYKNGVELLKDRHRHPTLKTLVDYGLRYWREDPDVHINISSGVSTWTYRPVNKRWQVSRN